MKKIFILALLLLVILGGWYFYNQSVTEVPKQEGDTTAASPKEATYIINGESFTLVDGFAEKETAPGSVTTNKVSVFGEPAFGDIDGDGDEDAVLILVNEPGGSGTFYYAVIAINIDGQYQGTDGILLGDRIAPQNYRVYNRRAEVNYVVRQAGEDFSVQPSVGKTLHLQFDPETQRLIEVMVDFEGEADPARMSLDMQPWTWILTRYYNDDTENFVEGNLENIVEVKPRKVDAFKLTFQENQAVSIATDCNMVSGTYTLSGNRIVFNPGATTLMFCEDSQEQEFLQMLGEAETYAFTGKGELVLELKDDKGSIIFR